MPAMAIIRAPGTKDFDAIAEITNHYVTTGAAHLAYRPFKPSDLRAIYQMRDRHPWYVYEDEGAILGYAKAGPWRDPREEAYQRTCEVAVYVAERAQRRGIGRKLYDAVLDESAKHYRVAIARIALPNPAAIALHEKCGFEHCGTLRDVAVKNRAWLSIDLWQKRLQAGEAA